MTTTTECMKKDFQKAVKRFRDWLPDDHIKTWDGREITRRPEYPKAMLTSAQISKRTATVNFGRGPAALEDAHRFQQFRPFLDWCETYGAHLDSIEPELNADSRYQLRVYY